MRVLLDTDIIFDFMLKREPFFQAASDLILLNTNGQFDGYISKYNTGQSILSWS